MKRKLALILLLALIGVSLLGVGTLPAHTQLPLSWPTPAKQVVNAVYLTNQSTPQKWEKHFTADTNQTNLQNTVEYLSSLGTRHPSTPECNTSADYILAALQSYGYTPLVDPFTITWKEASYTTRNIYCVKQSTVSSEIVLLACHYDSLRVLRIGEAVIGVESTNCPGAADNAAGVAVLLETARLLANVSLNKTVVFAFLSGEEGNSTTEHWFGSQQLISQGYLLFTPQLSNIIRVVYLDTLGEPPYGEPHGNIALYTDPQSPHKNSLVEAAQDLGINITVMNGSRASSASEAQREFCSEWKLQSTLPTVTISQENWTLAASNRLTSLDTSTNVDYQTLKNVTRLVAASMVREFFTLPPSSPSYWREWNNALNTPPGGVSLHERDYSEYLANPDSSVVIIGPGLNLSTQELQQLVEAGKPVICTGLSGVKLLKALGAQANSLQSHSNQLSLAKMDLLYHPVWDGLDDNTTVEIGGGESTLITSEDGSTLNYLECEGACWLGFYYGNPSLRHVFYVGRDNPENLSSRAKRILRNLVAWASLGEEYTLHVQPRAIVAGENVNLTVAIRNALSWEIVEADRVNLAVTQNGGEIYRNELPASGGFVRVSLTLGVGECTLTASAADVTATRTVSVIPPFSVQVYSPPFAVQNQYFLLALRIESSSVNPLELSVLVPELGALSRVSLPPRGSVILYVPAVYRTMSPYDSGVHPFTVLVQGGYVSTSVHPILVTTSSENLIIGYVLPLAAVLSLALLLHRKVYTPGIPRGVRLREARRRERRRNYHTLSLRSEKTERFKEYLRLRGFREKAENRFYHPEMIIEMEENGEKTRLKIYSFIPFTSRRDFLELVNQLGQKTVPANKSPETLQWTRKKSTEEKRC